MSDGHPSHAGYAGDSMLASSQQSNGYRTALLLVCVFGLSLSFAPILASGSALFLKHISADFGWSRTQFSSLQAVTALGFACFAPFVGRLLDRFGPRVVIATAIPLFAAGIASYGFLPGRYPLFVVASFLVGIAAIGVSPLSYLLILPRYFDRRLGLATGVAMTGIGIGYTLVPQVVQSLIDSVGWRETYQALGLIALLPLPFIILVFRRTQPRSVMDLADPIELPGMTAGQAVRTSNFWKLWLSMFLVMAAVAGTTAHLPALLTDRGLSSADALLALSAVGLALTLARFATGYALDKAPVHIVGAIILTAALIGISLLWGGATGLALPVAAGLIGMAQGAEGDVLAIGVRRAFGLRAYGAIYGRCLAGYTLGGTLGPVGMALAYDRFGNYQAGLTVLGAFAVVAIVLMYGFRAAPRPATAG